jgi:hypothetical protein
MHQASTQLAIHTLYKTKAGGCGTVAGYMPSNRESQEKFSLACGLGGYL